MRWKDNCKTIPISKSNNLPILHTSPGTTRITEIITHPKLYNNPPLSFRAAKRIPQFKHNHQNDDSLEKIYTFDPKRSYKIKCNENNCADCTKVITTLKDEDALPLSSIQSMTPLQREFLHVHEKFDHVNFETLQHMARQGIIDKKFANVKHPK